MRLVWWWGFTALSVLVLVSVWAMWTTTCIDATTFSRCDTQPAAGWDGAVFVSIGAGAAIAMGIKRIRHTWATRPTRTVH